MRIKQKDVPIKFRRIAIDHLESIRNSQIGLNTQDLYLGDDVCPIYRADIDSAAYYEFQVLKATRENVDNRKDLLSDVKKINLFTETGFKAVYSTPDALKKLKDVVDVRLLDDVQGFIMVSAGKHDFPVPHWSLESAPPSFYIEHEANSLRKKLSKIFKVDTLAYLGEDANGEEIAHLGSIPPVIKGLPVDLKEFEGVISSSVSDLRSSKNRFMDDSHKLSQGRTINRGPKPKDFTFVESTWKTLKKEFKTSFKPMLEMLKANAKTTWDTQIMIEEMGEGIIAGQVFNIAPLEKEFTVEISGEAAEFVVLRVVKRQGGFSVIELSTTELPFERESNLTVVLNYEKNYQEKINLFVVNKTAPSGSINNIKTEEQ